MATAVNLLLLLFLPEHNWSKRGRIWSPQYFPSTWRDPDSYALYCTCTTCSPVKGKRRIIRPWVPHIYPVVSVQGTVREKTFPCDRSELCGTRCPPVQHIYCAYACEKLIDVKRTGPIQILQAKRGWPDWKSATLVRWKSNWKLCFLWMPNVWTWLSNETCYVLFLLRLLLGDSYDSQERTLERTKDLSVTFVIPAAASRHKTIAKSATMLQKHAFFIWKNKRENKNIRIPV